jgi:four helix bundle protein
LRSATSIGANYEEARRAESKADFIHKVRLGAKEAGESRYWLSLAQRAGLTARPIPELVQEANELTAILTASARKASENAVPATPIGPSR